MVKMCPVVHFEFPAKDRKRISAFYSGVFGWKAEMLGEEMGNYVLATTTESGRDGPKRPGAINGGFYLSTDDPFSQYPSVVIEVAGLEGYMDAVRKAGGRVHGEPMDIPNVGRFVSIIDTEGNRVSLLEPLRK